MAKVIAGMTMSLDGFVEDHDGSAGALYPDLAELRDVPYTKAMQAETGAVLMGRRTFEMAGDPDSYADTYELQVPIFVVTHTPPPVEPKPGRRAARRCHAGPPRRWPAALRRDEVPRLGEARR